MGSNKKKDRRNFLKSMLGTPDATGATPPVGCGPDKPATEKIKMLTADGKIVLIERSVFEKKAGSQRASDKEVFDWMSDKHKA